MAVCAVCHAELPPGARFCPACGTTVGAPGAGEERKVVTVLFADLVGFTSHAERLDPEDVRAVQAPYAARLRAELERYGGTAEKFIGDAVMGLFGAPVSREDDPERAVRAALAIRDAVADLNEAGPAFELRVRVGVNTGEALVALGARPEDGEATASGDVVNTAKRLEEAAPPGGVLVGESTWRATRDAIEYRTAEPVVAKGKAEPVPVWEAVAPRAEIGADLRAGRRTPLVGRADEVDMLRHALDRARRDRTPQLVTLIGVPGIGKSRLVAELASALDAEPDLVFWRRGRSLPYGEGVTFWAAAEMVKAQAGVLATDTADEAGTKLALAVRALIADEAEARWVEPHLRRLVGIDSERAPEEPREREFSAWRRFFEAMAEHRPLVLVFEDLHWADDALLDFVDELVDRSADVPLLVIATSRPELLARRPGWGGGKRNATTISLSPLTDEQTARLLGALLERPVLQADVQTELLALVGGNPLCAEEYVRMLIDRGLVSGGRIATGPPLPLPETVQGIIAARLDALGADEKALVQDAAVVGRSFWPGALVALGFEGDGLGDLLHRLERKEFVRRERSSAVAKETQYAFSHVLVRDVAYGQIPRARRGERHRRAADWLESLRPDRAQDRAEMLAHHYLAALEFDRAAGRDTAELEIAARKALRAAAERASALHAPAAAARLYGEALELWPGDDPDRDELLFRRGRALLQSGEPGAELVAQARDALLRAGRKEVAAEAEVTLADDAWAHGQSGEALEALGRARDLLADSPPTPVKAYVHSRFTGFLMADGQEERALELGRQTLAMAEGLGLEDVIASVLVSIGVARTSLGDVSGLRDLARSLEFAERTGPAEVARSQFNLGSAYANLGELERAFGHYASGAGAARKLGDPAVTLWFEAEGLYERYWRGEWDEALEAAERASAGWASFDAGLVGASIFRARGNLDRAQAESTRALTFAREAETAQALLPALASAARTAVDLDDPGTAAALLDELRREWAGTQFIPGFWAAEAAFAAAAAGRREPFEQLLDGSSARTRWVDAACAYLAEDFTGAADTFALIGSAPDEAFARLRAAESLVLAGRRAEADVQLRPALAFHRAVGARRYVRAGEALLSASA